MGHLNFHNNATLNVFTLHINKDLKKCKVFPGCSARNGSVSHIVPGLLFGHFEM